MLALRAGCWPNTNVRSGLAALTIVGALTFLRPFVAQADLRIDVATGRPPERILVFVVRGEGVDIPVVTFQDEARRTLEDHLHARVVSMEEAFVRGGAELQTKLAECRGEDACYARLAAPVEATYLLVLTASRVSDLSFVGARLLDLGVVQPIGNAIDPLQPGETMLDVVADRIRGAVPPAMWDPFGTLLVNAPDGAEISINGKVIGVAPLDRIGWMVPGGYRVGAGKAGFKPNETRAEIVRGEETSVSIELEPEDSGSSWILWTAIGAAILGGAAAAVVLATRDPGEPVLVSCEPNRPCD